MIWLGPRSRRHGLLVACVAAIGMVCVSAQTAWSQTLVSIQNGKLIATVGEAEDLNSVNVAGRFGITEASATGGVLLQLPRSSSLNQLGSYVTVRIDGGTPFLQDGTVAEGVPGWDIAWGYEDTPDTDITGEWVQAPTAISPTRLVAKWRTIPDAAADPRIPEIHVNLDMRIVYDMVLYKFTVINLDTSAHSVGLRFAQDFAVPNTTDGPILTPTTPQITHETSLISSLIPDYWRSAGTEGTSTVGAHVRNSGMSNYPTNPDRLIFGLTDRVTGPLWDFTPNSGTSLLGPTADASAALYFNPVQLATGQSRVFSTILGAAGSSYEFGDRIAAGLEGPVSLKYDPSKPEAQRLQPSPFRVTAFLHNMNTINLSNVRAVLSLPSGLSLDAGENPVKMATSVGVDGEATFTWNVVPTGAASGRLTYSVALSADPGGQGVSVARDIDIPSLPSQPFGAGWQMVSFPYVLDDRTPAGAINLDPAMYDLVRWNPTAARYQAVQYLNPGEGYWLRLPEGRTVTLANAQPVNVPGGDFELNLTTGWTQIANPFLLPVRWGDLRVLNLDRNDRDYLVPLSVAEASSFERRWISPTIFRYDVQAGMYKFDQDFGTEMKPFVGYWVHALKPNLVLVISKPSGRAASVAATRGADVKGGWKLRLNVTDGTTQDGWNFIGVGRDAKDGVDQHDVMKPPTVADSVNLAILGLGQGIAPERLAQDIRSASPTAKRWQISVSSATPNADLTLTWPDISTLPRTYELYISDGSNPARQAMRTTSSLRINTGPAGTRMITLDAEPRAAAGAFRITSWNVLPTKSHGSATISVSASQTATLSIRVLGPGGAMVRRLTGRAGGLGQTSEVTWDQRDSRGIAVPAGAYTVEIKATSTDGQSARVVAPLVVTR